MMNFGLLDYESVHGKFNVGDYVQSIAAAQFLPVEKKLISREHLNTYSGEKLAIILNGWFMHQPLNWPPSKQIEPLFISFHMNKPYISRMLTKESISYMKAIGTIGCRDHYTAKILRDHDIDAYYSGCLTLTLGETYKFQGERSGILFVDTMHSIPDIPKYASMPFRYIASHLKNGNVTRSFKKAKALKNIMNTIPQSLHHEVDFIENSIDSVNLTSHDKFDIARSYLDRLSKARIVITSRIHCALPCLALGTPVIFVKYGQTSLSNIYRFSGVIDHFNVLDLDRDLLKNGITSPTVDVDQIDWDVPAKNPNTFVPLVPNLRSRCIEFINHYQSKN